MRVAVASGTTSLHLALHEAAAQQRITLVPLPLRDPPASLRALVQTTGAQAIAADAAHADLADAVAPDLPRVSVEQCMATPPGGGAYAVLQTSGTTGPPRLVAIPGAALAAHRRAAMARLRSGPDSVWSASLPLWHIGGVALVDRCLHGGGRLVLPQGVFDGRAPLPAETTHVSVVPTMLRRLLATPAPPSLQCVLVGGDALPPELARTALTAGWPVHASYGLTEACSQVATASPDEVAQWPGTSGFPLDGVAVRIETVGRPAEPGAIGEIVVAGPTVAVEGPLATGDLGWLDEEGRLFVVGRSDDRITTGGEKVHPEAVEQVLMGCPGVEDVAVVGWPDAQWGQRVVAFVVGAAGEVQSFARARLPVHAVPKEVHQVAQLPRTPGGKLRRGALRAIASQAGSLSPDGTA